MGSVCTSIKTEKLKHQDEILSQYKSKAHSIISTNPYPVKSKEIISGPKLHMSKISLHPNLNHDEIIEAKNSEILPNQKTEAQLKLIMNALNHHFILRSLDDDSRKMIAHNMIYLLIGPNEIIFEEGNPGVGFFIVASGRLEVIANGSRTEMIGPGIGFGEHALLDDRPRYATVKTCEKCTL